MTNNALLFSQKPKIGHYAFLIWIFKKSHKYHIHYFQERAMKVQARTFTGRFYRVFHHFSINNNQTGFKRIKVNVSNVLQQFGIYSQEKYLYSCKAFKNCITTCHLFVETTAPLAAGWGKWDRGNPGPAGSWARPAGLVIGALRGRRRPTIASLQFELKRWTKKRDLKPPTWAQHLKRKAQSIEYCSGRTETVVFRPESILPSFFLLCCSNMH
jgi:hypothetical protein